MERNRNMNVFNKKNISILAVMLLVFMVVGSFFDYQISQALFNIKSPFGIFFASFGQLPAMLCFAAGGTLLFKLVDSSRKISSFFCIVFGILLNLLAVSAVTMDPMLYIENMPLALSAVIAVTIVAVVDILIVKLTKESSREQIKKFITLAILTMFLQALIINIIKIPWGRPRMRMISVTEGASFQPWWVIGSEMKTKLMALGVASEEFKSFPSGHTGCAACALLLAALPLLSDRLKGKETMLLWIGVAFTIVVAFSRIIMGAHFLTDVTVGMSVTVLVISILMNILYKKA